MSYDANTMALAVLGVAAAVKAVIDYVAIGKQNRKLDRIEDTSDKIHTLTNGNMERALQAAVVALRCDFVSKQRIADLTKAAADMMAVTVAQKALLEAEALLARQRERQATVDKATELRNGSTK